MRGSQLGSGALAGFLPESLGDFEGSVGLLEPHHGARGLSQVPSLDFRYTGARQVIRPTERGQPLPAVERDTLILMASSVPWSFLLRNLHNPRSEELVLGMSFR